MEDNKIIDTFSDYINDDTRVSAAERERIGSEIDIIGKTIEARESLANK